MDPAEYALVVVNLAVGFGCGIHLARVLANVGGKQANVLRYFAIVLGVYFIECVAIVTGMGIPAFSVGLAFVWGGILGLWLRTRTSGREALRTALLLSLYSSLPAFSFVILPLLGPLVGWSILSAQEGARLGIPDFIPWPLNTILGFYAIPAAGAVVLKVAITTGEVRLLCHPTRAEDRQLRRPE